MPFIFNPFTSELDYTGTQGFPQVDYWSELPAANTVPNAIYIVRKSSGVWLINYHASGWYRSDGSNWIKYDDLQEVLEGITLTDVNGFIGGNGNTVVTIADTPLDSLTYARKDAEWTDISSLIFPKIVSWAGSESFDDLYTRCLPYLEHPLPIILHGDGHVISGVDEGGYRQASNMLLFSADPEGQKTVIIAGETFYFSRGFPQLLRGVRLINTLRRTILELDGTSANWIIGEDCEIATEEGGSYFIATTRESGTLNVYSRGKIGRQVFNDATALGSGRFTVDVYDGSEIEGQIVTTINRETQLTFNIYAPALIGVQEGLGLIKNYFNTADELAFADAISGLVSTTTQDAIIETNTRVSSIIAGSVAHTSITTGALSVGTRRVTGNTTVTDTDCGIIADTTSQNITVTLPSAAGRVGRIIYITKSSANNTLTIMPFGTNKIIGESSLEIEDNYVTIALKASTLATWDLI